MLTVDVGFAAPNNAGKMVGIDASVCDAVAAAVLGDANAVKYVPLTAAERFTALSAGEVDLLSRNTTHTLTRDATLVLISRTTTLLMAKDPWLQRPRSFSALSRW